MNNFGKGFSIKNMVESETLPRLIRSLNHLSGARLLLTGGTGFVGRWLLRTARDAQVNSLNQIEIVIPTRDLASPHAQSALNIDCPNVSWIEGNFLEDNIDFGKVDMIIHAATPASAKLNEANPVEMLHVNFAAMESVLRLAGNNTPLLFTSSGAVYGTQLESMPHIPERFADPSAPIGELSAYAQGKRTAEQMCMEAGDDGRCNPIIARLFAFGGEYLPRDTHFAIGNFVQNALDRKPIVIKGDGRSRRSYLYGADMATWLWSALADGGNGEPLHIGSEHSISILELAQNVARVSGEVLNYVPEIIVSEPVNESLPVHQYVPSTAQTRKILNVEEWTGLDEIIVRMMRASAS
jgi:nucleoside-diphosphate-sugar epimerase